MPDGYTTIKLPNDVDDSDLLTGEQLRERKNELGLTWLEFINRKIPILDALDDRLIEEVDNAGDNLSKEELREAVRDGLLTAIDAELSADMREAAYQGSREALEEARH